MPENPLGRGKVSFQPTGQGVDIDKLNATPELQNLANRLKTIKKGLYLQTTRGDVFKVVNNPNGTFSVFMGELKLDQPIGSEQMAPSDVLGIAKNIGSFDVAVAENKNLVKLDILRKKVQEYFIKNPNAKSVVIRASLGESTDRTVWRVKKSKKGFNIVEVNARRKEFLMEAPVGGQTPPPGTTGPLGRGTVSLGKAGAKSFNIQQFESMPFKEKISMFQSGLIPLSGETITIAFADLLKTGAGNDVVALRDFIQQNHQMADPASKAAVGSALGFLTNLSNQRRLMRAHKNPLGEADEKGSNEEQPPEEVGAERDSEQPMPQVSGKDKHPQKGVKTGEELQLQQLVQAKPVESIDVDSDESGGHIVLSLAGLENPLEIHISKDGKIKYKLGDLARVIKTS